MTFRRGLYTAGTRVRWETLDQWLTGLDVMLAHNWRRKQIRAHVCALAETPEVIRVADAATCARVAATSGRWPWTDAVQAARTAIVPCSCSLETHSCGHCWNGPSLVSHWPSERYRWVCVFCRMMIGGGEAALMWSHALAELQRRCGDNRVWRASSTTSTEYHTERLNKRT